MRSEDGLVSIYCGEPECTIIHLAGCQNIDGEGEQVSVPFVLFQVTVLHSGQVSTDLGLFDKKQCSNNKMEAADIGETL